MDSPIENYILKHIDEENELLHQLNRETHIKQLRPRMLSGHLQGRILSMIAHLLKPKRILELGTYTGYSALCLAEGLAPGGELHTIEINDELENFTRSFINQSPLKELIHLHVGDIELVVPQIKGKFDLVFIDANKRHYIEYYNLVFERINEGGFILADNTLWDGKVIDCNAHNEEQTKGILLFNEYIKNDTRVEKIILPIRDGLSIIRKK